MRVTVQDGTSLTSAGEGRYPVGQTSILSRIRTNPSPVEQANLPPVLVIFQFNRNYQFTCCSAAQVYIWWSLTPKLEAANLAGAETLVEAVGWA